MAGEVIPIERVSRPRAAGAKQRNQGGRLETKKEKRVYEWIFEGGEELGPLASSKKEKKKGKHLKGRQATQRGR